MSRRFHMAAVHIAIVAMLLRALLPVGWMPDPDGAAAFTICTMDGSGHHTQATPPGKPVPDDSRRSHDECPFAASPHVAAPVPASHLPAPALTGRVVDALNHARVLDISFRFQPHSPRAPPRIA
jgi:hypothetical protein